MISNRLELALERLKSSDWGRFERLSSAFLVSEFEDLRTVASPAGDGGRDAELFSPLDESTVVLQYSVATDWAAKINTTVRRLKDTMPNVIVLIYVTNQVIGAAADSIKKRLRVDHGLSLDVRDRNWFLDRVLGFPGREKAAEELACVIVDPYLAAAGVGPYVRSALSNEESIAAVTFLGLQWQDAARDKGLTKLAFESLVLAALVNTDSTNQMDRHAIRERVFQLLPDHPHDQVRIYVDTALERLTKKVIRRFPGDKYCLTFEETVRLNEFRVTASLAESNLGTAINNLILSNFHVGAIPAAHEAEFIRCLRVATDAVLFDRSQSFAMAVQTGKLAALADTEFKPILIAEIGKSALPKLPKVDWVALLRSGVQKILTSHEVAIQAHLRRLADSYTLLAFLKLTPDVQGAVEKMFSDGKIWLDATVILPLIADTLLAAEGESGRFMRMIDAARDAGLHLYVTPGIIEEVERHMNRALTCAQLVYGKWHGSVPFLLERYIGSGRSTASFSAWLENFRGSARPTDDISDYLKDQFEITTRSLEVESSNAPLELRHALDHLWHERYQRRQEKYGIQLDPNAVTRLVRHDIECYCGVLQLREKDRTSPFGYSAWWLTVDQQTYDLKSKLQTRMEATPPDSPVISADFLVNYLAFGPNRRRVSKSKESHLPLLMMFSNGLSVTPALMAEAETLRSNMKDMPERLIRRNVRDHLDRARTQLGPISYMGMDQSDPTDTTSLLI
jgi:hypothetical protein